MEIQKRGDICTGFPGGSAGKEYTCNVGDLGLIPGLGRSPGEGNEWLPTPVFSLGEFHGLHSPWVASLRVGGDSATFTFIYTANSLCCTPETTTTL